MKKLLFVFVCSLFSSFMLDAQENLAIGKTATQSSKGHAKGEALKAIDGNYDGSFNNSFSITHTKEEANPWWQVDLGAVYDLTKIKLHNRTDCCGGRLKNFTILVSETPFTSNTGGTAFATNEAYASNPVRSFTGNSQGRYVRVFLNGTGILSLAEVEVFGTKALPNIALGKTATQSSDYGGLASKAVDGNTDGNYNTTNGSLTHTNNDDGAWWQVDLGAIYDITKIKLYNRTDCCAERLDDFTILISETEMTDNSRGTTFAANVPYTENPIRSFSGNSQGRYVRVFLNGKNYMSLAEVEVFGEEIEEENELYLVTIKTAENSGAGTDAQIEVRLHDDKGNSTPWQTCDDPRENDFENGMETTYILDAPTLAGTLKDIELRLTDNGTDDLAWKFHSARVDYSGGYNFKTNPNGQGNNAWFSDPANSTNLKSRKFPLAMHTSYSVTIKTADESGAGTDAKIEARLFDDKGNITPWVECNNEKNLPIIKGQRRFNDFENGMETTYILDVPSLQGALKNIEFRLTVNRTKDKAWKFQSAKVNYSGGPEFKTNPKGQGDNGWFLDPDNLNLKNRKYPLAKYTPYSISVETADISGAGTDARIEVRLHDDNGNTSPWALLEPPLLYINYQNGQEVRRNDFEQGEYNTYTVELDSQLETLKDIEFRIIDNNTVYSKWAFHSAQVNFSGGLTYKTDPNGQPQDLWFSDPPDATSLKNRKYPLTRYTSYPVTIKTGDVSGAGTDGKITVRLYDDQGNITPWVKCNNEENFPRFFGGGKNPVLDDFEQGRETTYIVDVPRLPGVLSAIEISIDKNDTENHQWNLQSVSVSVDGWVVYELREINEWFCHKGAFSAMNPNISCHKTKKYALKLRPNPYFVTINTANIGNAGTDADIEVQLHDDQGNITPWVLCDDPLMNDFEQGQENSFPLYVDKLPGKLQDIKLRISGDEANDQWTFRSAKVRYYGETTYSETDAANENFCNDDQDCNTEKKFPLFTPTLPNVQIQLEKIIYKGGIPDFHSGIPGSYSGNIYAQVNGEKKILWSRSAKNSMVLGVGEAHQLNQTVFYKNIGDKDIITLDGEILFGLGGVEYEPISLSLEELLSSNKHIISFTYKSPLIKGTITVGEAHFTVSKPSGPYLHLKSIKCISPSSGTDQWTTFGVALAIEGIMSLSTLGMDSAVKYATNTAAEKVFEEATKGIVIGTNTPDAATFTVPGDLGQFLGPQGLSSRSTTAAKSLIEFSSQFHDNEDDDLYLTLGGLRIWPHGRWNSIGSQETQVINQFYPLLNDLELKIMEYDSGGLFGSGDDFMGSHRFLTVGGKLTKIGPYAVHIIYENEGSYYELSYEILYY